MNLFIRKATIDDIDFVYKLANDPTVRQNAFSTEPIPYEEHVTWYNKVLKATDRVLYIISDGDSNIGTVRFDIEETNAVISYSVCSNMRGKGYGTAMILLAEKQLLADRSDVSRFIAEVKYENIPSAKVFIKNGYLSTEKKDCLEFAKDVKVRD